MSSKIRLQHAIAIASVCCVPGAWADSEVSLNGGAFQAASSPVTVFQGNASTLQNAAAAVERGAQSDSWIDQAGYYNRAASVQLGSASEQNVKYSDLYQQGRFNRGLIAQVGQTATDTQSINTKQTGDGATNALFTFQTSANPADWDRVDAAWASLDLAQAKTVAHNFIHAPELSRGQVRMAEDVAMQFISGLAQQQDIDRFAPQGTGAGPGFVMLNYGKSRRDDVLGALGYRQHTRGLTVGVRYALTPQTRLGVALNVSDADAGLHQDMGSVATRAYQLAGFGTHARGPYQLDWMLSWGRFDFNARRFADAMRVSSDNQGQAYTGRVQGSYFLQAEQVRWGPFVSVTYTRATSDAYNEQGNVLLAQQVTKEDRRRLLGSLGAAWHLDGKLSSGRALRSHVKLEWVHDKGIDSRDHVSSRFAMEPDVQVVTPLRDSALERYGRISAGMQLAVTAQIDLVLAGQHQFGSQSFRRDNAYLGLSWVF
ncbi:autotransporter outer membrane beta-barrel domain-containing protein [Zoogloea sp.]|uniref:autotransporter outer membrane beta-barrel domain-containing protein n=1 Tax=Zoogloea sp. TaxID=49181 RepID=UPI0026030398|nr:autotransporter outer membrane beta-barrel domain-containing protein [Zoogloea sp.]MDD3353076.1 autotransporter outer membrane beta-barrel domain-containing protein [Zoogloea sp.]